MNTTLAELKEKERSIQRSLLELEQIRLRLDEISDRVKYQAEDLLAKLRDGIRVMEGRG